MSNGPWTDEENDLIVADYFAMLVEDMAGRPYNKAQHRRSLMPLVRSRTEGSIEFKHQNISAVLKGLGEDWIPGYKPSPVNPGRFILPTPLKAFTDVMDDVKMMLRVCALHHYGWLPYLDTLRWVFIAVALAGVAVTIYAQLDDWRRGQR